MSHSSLQVPYNKNQTNENDEDKSSSAELIFLLAKKLCVLNLTSALG